MTGGAPGPRAVPQGGTRFFEHAQGRVQAKRARRPLRLAYYEACSNAADAYRRQLYLKSGRGKRHLRQGLSEWLDTVRL